VRLPDDEWLDIVEWRSAEDFAASRAKGADLPGIAAFFATLGELVSSEEGVLVESDLQPGVRAHDFAADFAAPPASVPMSPLRVQGRHHVRTAPVIGDHRAGERGSGAYGRGAQADRRVPSPPGL
jgi:hypothetical protein